MITTCILDNQKSFAEFLKSQLHSYGNYQVLHTSAFNRHVDGDIGDLLHRVDLLILGVNSESECLLTVERILNHSEATCKLILHDITDGSKLTHFLSLDINGLISKMCSRKSMMEHIEDSITYKYFICPRTSGHLIGYFRERNRPNTLD